MRGRKEYGQIEDEERRTMDREVREKPVKSLENQKTARKTEGETPRRSGSARADGIRRSSAGTPGKDGIRRTSAGAPGKDGIRRNSAGAPGKDGIRRSSAGAPGKDGIRRSGVKGPAPEPRKQGKKQTKKKRAAFDAVSTVVLIAAVCVFVFSLYQLIVMLVPYYTGSKEYDEIRDLAVTSDQDGEGFSVDFDMLKEENPDTIGWIRFDEPAVINYPVVKSADNEEYLTKTFTDNDNKLGAIFVDYRNNSDFSDRNTFIYGHNMRVGEQMFSQLKKYRDEEFGRANPYFYIYMPSGEVRTYTVFSAGVVDARSDNYKIEYANDEEFQQYLDLCLEESLYDFGVEVDKDSKIVSLSTCTSVTENERFLVHGVLTAVN